MKILSGVYTRDSGNIEIFGQKIEGDLNTKQAQALGVAIIHQELNMCQHLTVAANMFLGRELVKGGRLNTAEMNRRATEELAKLGIHDLDPNEIVGMENGEDVSSDPVDTGVSVVDASNVADFK